MSSLDHVHLLYQAPRVNYDMSTQPLHSSHTLCSSVFTHTPEAERKSEEECPIQKSKGGKQEEVGSALAALAIFPLLTPPFLLLLLLSLQ